MLRPVEAIRADFPAFESTAGEAPPARFDGPGGTQVPRLVIDAVADYLARHNANAHWHFPASERTDALVAAAREAFAAFVGGGPDEIVFGPNMTSLAMHVARGLGR
ncbi:MAG: aminotransferase class V-fold PLP-dependent enzyme, partial [Gemmatimonadetes bacterium]|nr:aminotransferase class V-fold PLP-dependent enzyme [Gemmatimonadota bacterium]